jgi:hypothetical protein
VIRPRDPPPTETLRETRPPRTSHRCNSPACRESPPATRNARHFLRLLSRSLARFTLPLQHALPRHALSRTLATPHHRWRSSRGRPGWRPAGGGAHDAYVRGEPVAAAGRVPASAAEAGVGASAAVDARQQAQHAVLVLLRGAGSPGLLPRRATSPPCSAPCCPRSGSAQGDPGAQDGTSWIWCPVRHWPWRRRQSVSARSWNGIELSYK